MLRQQELERDILEMNLQQKEIALELEKSKNNQAQLQNQADIAQAQADIKKTEARQDLTPEQKETQLAADYANLQAKILAGANLYYQGQLLDSQGAINQYQADVERSNQARQQDLAYDSARADYVRGNGRSNTQAASSKGVEGGDTNRSSWRLQRGCEYY